MASTVDACNVSLSNIGHNGDVTSIDPPDGSAYASYCARFFPLARDFVLESFPWSFALKRKTLAEVADIDPPESWGYTYQLPSDYLRAISVLPEGYSDDNTVREDFIIEGDYIYSNAENATIHYIARVTDTAKWPPSVFVAVCWKLSQYLAGVIVKGDAQMRVYCAKEYESALQHAASLNAKATKVTLTHTPIWISDR